MSALTDRIVKGFVEAYGEELIPAITNTGLFFPAVVGQLSVEGSDSKDASKLSGLAQNYNNFGGIKGNASNGVLLDTTEVVNGVRVKTKDYFRKFDHFADFIDYYVRNLQTPRYINAGVFTAKTPQEQITRMVQAGYSTMTPKQYLAGGVNDRIKATQNQYPFAQIWEDAAQKETPEVLTKDFWGLDLFNFIKS